MQKAIDVQFKDENKKMKKDIMRIFMSNIMKMGVTFVTAFIIPMILSVDDYGYYKLYTFYASYIGLSHFGFCDGIYLRYGGKNLECIDKTEIHKESSTLLTYELFVSFVIVIAGIVKKDLIIICLGIVVVPHILFTYFSYIYQATGNFSAYTSIINFSTICNLAFNFILVLLKVSDYKAYIYSNLSYQIVALVFAGVLFAKQGLIHYTGFSLDIFTENIKLGILLLVGNFAYTLFIGIDKWFIKFTMNITDFSFYSFASQMLTVINMFVTPISLTLYSNISRKKNIKFEIKVKRLLVVFLMLIPIAIYAIIFIITTFITQYTKAIDIISMLLITQIFLSINMVVFVNLYKAYREQKQYFFRLLGALGSALCLDLIVSLIEPNTVFYALATLFSCFIWLGLNLSHYKYMKPSKQEIIYIVSLLLIFEISSIIISNIFINVLIYLSCYIILTKLLMTPEWKYMVSLLHTIFKNLKFSKGGVLNHVFKREEK